MKDESICIGWTNKPFKTLGTWFSSIHDETAHLNITSKLNHIKAKVLAIKITVIKSLLVPHILLLASVTVLSKKVIAHFESLLCNIVWSNRKDLIEQLTEAGNIKMPSVRHIVDSVKILWVKRLYNNCKAKWNILAERF